MNNSSTLLLCLWGWGFFEGCFQCRPSWTTPNCVFSMSSMTFKINSQSSNYFFNHPIVRIYQITIGYCLCVVEHTKVIDEHWNDRVIITNISVHSFKTIIKEDFLYLRRFMSWKAESLIRSIDRKYWTIMGKHFIWN